MSVNYLLRDRNKRLKLFTCNLLCFIFIELWIFIRNKEKSKTEEYKVFNINLSLRVKYLNVKYREITLAFTRLFYGKQIASVTWWLLLGAFCNMIEIIIFIKSVNVWVVFDQFILFYDSVRIHRVFVFNLY
jgi:hypothetical protein